MFNLLSPVKDLMSTHLITIDKDATLAKVNEIFNANKIHHIPVVQDARLIGIVSKSDFLFFRRGYSHGESIVEEMRLKSHFVHEIMTTGIAKLNPDDKINVALEIFNENLFHAIPVESEGKLVGIITTYDIINALSISNGAVAEYAMA